MDKHSTIKCRWADVVGLVENTTGRCLPHVRAGLFLRCDDHDILFCIGERHCTHFASQDLGGQAGRLPTHEERQTAAPRTAFCPP